MKHAKVKEKQPKKRGKGFRIFLIVWIVLLLALGAYAAKYVNGMLKEMQANSVNQIISDRVSAMGDDELDKYFSFNRELEDNGGHDRIREFFKNGSFIVKRVPNTDTYNIYNSDQQILSAEIKRVESVNKLGIFNYGIMEFKGFSATEEKSFLDVEITVPNDYAIQVGGKLIQPTEVSYAEGFKDAGNFVELPGESVYVLDHLTQWPELRITDGGKDIKFNMDRKISLGLEYEKCASLEAAGCDFDAIDFIQKWMKFMQNDLSGGRRGFNTLEKCFIKDSDQYVKAYQWATNVDITFVSDHVILNPAFTDEAINNVVKYSDDAVSFDGYMKFHIKVRGKEQPQTFNSTIYLIKYDGAWRVVNIRGKVK